MARKSCPKKAGRSTENADKVKLQDDLLVIPGNPFLSPSKPAMMKRVYSYCVLAQLTLFWATQLQAQTPSTLEGKISAMFEPLNKSEVTSDILMQQTPVFLWPGIYDGVHIPDSLALSRSQWCTLFGQFRGAAVDSSFLPDPKVYTKTALQQHHTGLQVPMMFMATQFDIIRQGAVDDGLIYWKNGQCFDNPYRMESPYRLDTCFALAPVFADIQGLEVTYVFPDSLLFNNLDWKIDSFEVDLGDGLGWKWAWSSIPMEVEYDSDGRKEILIRITQSGKSKLAHTWVNVEDNNLLSRSGENGPYQEKNPEIINLPQANLSLFSSCSDGKIRKPLILVEGYPNYTYAEKTLFNGLLASQNSDLEAWLNDREFDIIWVDWKDNNTGVADAADKLITTIEWINNRKHTDGSYESNVLIGASFGGLVSKYALLKMHNLEGKDSEVGTFFTYDSPLKGANFPIGIQAFLLDLEQQVSVLGASTIEIQQALGLLNSPAPKDMLIGQVSMNGWASFEVNLNGFQSLDEEISSMESIRPLNEITRFITLSNGADLGNTQSYLETGENILHFNLELDKVDDQFITFLGFSIEVPENCYDVKFVADAWTADQFTNKIYSRQIYLDNHCGNDVFNKVAELNVPEPAGLDNAPGGNSNLGLSLLNDGLQNAVNALKYKENFEFTLLDGFSFIPTVSSLDMLYGTDRYSGNPQGGASVLRWTASEELTPLVWDYGKLDFNQSHVSMDDRIAKFLQSELDPVQINGLISPMQAGEIYNFGKTNPVGLSPSETPHVISEDITLENGSAIWINRFDRLGYTNGSNPINHHPQSFDVFVPGTSCTGDESPVTVNVGSEGKVLIGQTNSQSTNLGKLSFLPKSTLNVLQGGEVILAKEKFNHIVLQGGAMNIFSGGFVDARWGSQILIKEGSTLTVKSGGTLRISHDSELHVEKGGNLVFEPGAIVQLWDGQSPEGQATIHIHKGGELVWQGDIQFSGNGFFQFDQGNIFTVSTAWNLSGMGAETRMVRLNDKAVLNVPYADMSLSDGAVEFAHGSSLEHSYGETRLEKVTCYGNSFQSGFGIIDEYPEKVMIGNCRFDNLEFGYQVAEFHGPSSEFIVQNSTFDGCMNGFAASPAGWITVDQSLFKDCVTALYFREVKYAYINDCIIQGNNSNQDIGVYLEDVPVFRMHGGLIDGLDDGIMSLQGFQSNVFLYSQATVSNCNRGIYMQKGGVNSQGLDYGLVLLDCANLLNNGEGVIGEDVLLQVDAQGNAAQHPNQAVTPNTFVNGPNPLTTDDIFQICYDERDADPVLARQNVWGNGTPDPATDFDDHDLGSAPNGCTFTFNKVDNVVTDPVAQFVIDCPIPPRAPGFVDNGGLTQPPIFGSTETCLLGGAASIPAHDAWARGLERFFAEDLDASSTWLDPVAGVSESVRDTASLSCRHYIDVARVLVDAIDRVRNQVPARTHSGADGNAGLDWDGDMSGTIQASIELFPNPAVDVLDIRFGEGAAGRFRIVNGMGLVMHDAGISNAIRLDLYSWPEGMYEVQAMDPGGRVVTNERFMVVK